MGKHYIRATDIFIGHLRHDGMEFIESMKRQNFSQIPENLQRRAVREIVKELGGLGGGGRGGGGGIEEEKEKLGITRESTSVIRNRTLSIYNVQCTYIVHILYHG